MAFSKRLPLVVCLAVAPLVALPVYAEPTQAETDEARAFFKEGREQLGAKHYERAATLLEKAHRIMHVPPTAIDLMNAYALQDKLVEAWAIGEDMQKQGGKPKEPEPFVVARKKIDEAMEALASRTPTINLHILGTSIAGARTTIDGVMVTRKQLDKPIRVNPGTHKIHVTASYCDPFEKTLETEAGPERHYDVEVKLTCKPPPPAMPDNAARSKRNWIIAGSAIASGFTLAGVGMAIGSKITNDEAVYVASRAADCIDLAVCERIYDARFGASKAWAISSLVAFGVAVGIAVPTIVVVARGRASAEVRAQTRVSLQVVPVGNGLALHGKW